MPRYNDIIQWRCLKAYGSSIIGLEIEKISLLHLQKHKYFPP